MAKIAKKKKAKKQPRLLQGYGVSRAEEERFFGGKKKGRRK